MNHKESGRLGGIASIEHNKNKRVVNINNYLQNPKICNQCQTPIDYDKRKNNFCSHVCAGNYNNKNARKHTNIDSCLNCNSIIIGRIKRYNICCNNKCYQEFKFKNTISEWLNGKLESRATVWIKKYLIQLRGNKCELCNWCQINPVTKKVPIELEHIDGNSENNKIENLKLLCPNCHSLTLTYRALNKGHGRINRRKKHTQVD